jgi:hypothetical protein
MAFKYWLPRRRCEDNTCVAEPAERIDRTIFDWDWNSAGSGRSGRWEKAQLIGQATPHGAMLQNDNWQLMPDPLPPMQMTLASAGHVVRELERHP